MNALGISIPSLRLSPEQLLSFGNLFAPVAFEQDAKIDTGLSVLSQLNKDNQGGRDLFSLFRPLELGDSLNNFAAEALKLLDFSNYSSTVSHDLLKNSDASSLYLSQLSASNAHMNSLSLLGASAPSDSQSVFQIARGSNGGSSLSQIGEFQLPMNVVPQTVRPDPSNQRNQSSLSQRSASPFEAIRRPYEKFKAAANSERRATRGASALGLIFRAARQLVTGIMNTPTLE